MLNDFDRFDEFNDGSHGVGNVRGRTADGDLYEALTDGGDTEREVDFDVLIDVLLDLPANCSYDQRWKVLENFGWLLKTGAVSLNDSDQLLREKEALTQNLIDIHEGRIKDDDSIKKCFSELRKLFKK